MEQAEEERKEGSAARVREYIIERVEREYDPEACPPEYFLN
jgi:hypothetical protein